MNTENNLCDDNVVTFKQKNDVTDNNNDQACHLTVNCITYYLIQMTLSYASHKNNRELVNQVNHPRTQRLIKFWVYERLAKLTSRGAEYAAVELFPPLQENLKLWTVLND